MATFSMPWVFVTGGCASRGADTNGPQNDAVLKGLEEQAALSLPSGTRVLQHDDGGGRMNGYYEWLLLSRAEVSLPPCVEMGEKRYFEYPVDVSAKVIEARLGRNAARGARKAIGSRWAANGYEFRATLVRADAGDYLFIERFPEQGPGAQTRAAHRESATTHPAATRGS